MNGRAKTIEALEKHPTFGGASGLASQAPLEVALRDSILRLLEDDDRSLEELVTHFTHRRSFSRAQVLKAVNTLAERGQVDLILENFLRGVEIQVCRPIRGEEGER